MSFTRTQVRAAMYARESWIGFAASFDSIDAAGLYAIDVSEFDGAAASRLGTDQFSDLIIYRPGTTGDDIWKRIASIDGVTGKVFIGGSAWSDKTTLPYEEISTIPDRINGSISQGQKLQVSRTTQAVVTIADFDMETSGTSNWAGTATFTKDTSAGNVFRGTQSGKVAASGASQYTRSATLAVNPGKSYRVGVRVRADVGTFTLGIYDVTNSALLTETCAYSGERFAVLWLTFTTPATCEEIKVNFGLTGASDIAYVDTGFGPYWDGCDRIALPSHMDESYRLRLLRPMEHRVSISTTGGSGWDAASYRYIGDWEKPDYDVETYDRDVQPYNLVLQRELPPYPAEMLIERDLWQTEPLDSESAITTAPIDTVVIHAIYCLLLDITDTNDNPRWLRKLQEYKQLVGVRDVARVPQTRVMQTPFYMSNARGRGGSQGIGGYPSGTRGW